MFLQVASDCLEKIDLNKLDVPPTKVVGKKRYVPTLRANLHTYQSFSYSDFDQ